MCRNVTLFQPSHILDNTPEETNPGSLYLIERLGTFFCSLDFISRSKSLPISRLQELRFPMAEVDNFIHFDNSSFLAVIFLFPHSKERIKRFSG